MIKVQPYSTNQFRFKVHNHCGHLKIGPKSYFIIPKVGESFLRTMFKAIVNPPNFKIYQNELKQDDTENYFNELIAYLFIGAFNRSLSGRVRKGYINKNVSTYKSSGKIDIDKSKEFFAYSIKPPTWSRSEWNKDTKFNKALRTLFLNLSHLDVSNETKSKLVRIGLEMADSDYIGSIDYRQLLHQLDRVHENYKPLFELATLLNSNAGISSGSYKSYSLLLPTWLLFEQACQSQIAKLLPEEVHLEISFSKKVSKASIKTVIEPDIVIKNKQGEIVKIGDCKYSINKECKLEHLYQLNTYMDACKHFESFILYPNEVNETVKIESYPLNWGHRIDIVNIPTNNYDNFFSALQILLSDLPTTRLNVASA